MADVVEAEVEKEKLGCFPFIIGFLSFIPLLGVPLGIVVCVWGLITKKSGGKLLALIGAGGVAFTFLVYGTLFHYMNKKGGPFDQLWIKSAQENLPAAVQAIEYYKLQNHRYPTTLDEMLKGQPPSGPLAMTLMDPTAGLFDQLGKNKVKNFYYQLVDENHYYLLAVGEDHKPFTSDDIVPVLKPGEKTGLIIKTGIAPTANDHDQTK